MFGFSKDKKTTKDEAKDKPQAAPASPSDPQKPVPTPAPVEPEALGTGLAAKAGKALKDRRAQLEEAASYANGGMVSGPGTGTSDDIKTRVPAGSYIMPADSTAQIGQENLDGLGFKPNKVPVNLSNGEYQMPPEQVHAVGVQALNEMKDSTHQPVESESATGFAPKTYFADGGVVEDERKKILRQSVNNVAPGAGYVNPDMLAGAGKAALGAVASPFAAVIDAGYDARNKLLDVDPASSSGGNAKFLTAALDTAKQGGNQFGQGVEEAKGALRSDFGLQKATPTAAPSSNPSSTPSPAASPATAAAQPSSSQPAPAQALPAPSSAPTNQAQEIQSPPVDGLPNNVTRVGNSFSGTNIGLGFTVNGQRPSIGDGQRSPQNQAAVDALLARTPDLNAVPSTATPSAQPATAGFSPRGGGMTVIRDTSGADRERANLIRAASTPYAGAQNGQLTANQLNTLRAVQEGDQRTDLARTTNDANNATRLQEAQMQTDSASQRAAMQEVGANRRADASNQIDQRRLAGEEEARGFQTRAAQRQERLYEQYDKAKPEERAAIAQQIQQLTGRQAPNKFTVVPGGQEIDPATSQLVTRPAQVFDNQTGQFVQQQQGGGTRAPQIGEQRGQFRFKGGNPADQNNWEKI